MTVTPEIDQKIYEMLSVMKTFSKDNPEKVGLFVGEDLSFIKSYPQIKS